MPRRARSAGRELLVALLGVVVGILGGVDLIGHPARLVHVLTIFAGGMAAGVALGRALDRLRAERRAPTTVPPAA